MNYNRSTVYLGLLIVALNAVSTYTLDLNIRDRFEQTNRFTVDMSANSNEDTSNLLATRAAYNLKELASLSGENIDMELAEVNVFRPVFRYRAAYAQQVRNRGSFG